MLKIDCLVINTQIERDLSDAVIILANERAANKKDASVNAVFNDLRAAGIEIDIRSVGHVYAAVLNLNDKSFNTMQEVEDIVGQKEAKLMRNLMLMQDKEGEIQISDQSPGQAIAQTMGNAFLNASISDNRTKSVMRTLQEAVLKGAQRKLGELPATSPGAKLSWEQTVQASLDLEKIGNRDINGQVLGVKRLYDDARKELSQITAGVSEGDAFHQQQWEDYLGDLERATYALLFSRQEAKDVVVGSLKEGFGKTTRAGNTILDYNKMHAGLKGESQVWENIDNALKEKGFSDDARAALKVSLKEETHELFGEILRRASVEDEINAQSKFTEKTIDVMMANAFELNRRGYTLAIKERDAYQIVKEALKQTGYAKEDANGKASLDLVKMSNELTGKSAVRDAVEGLLEGKGYTAEQIASLRPFLDGVFREMSAEIKQRAKNELDNRDARLSADKKGKKDDFTRMSELNALGIFNRQHDALLNKTLGASDLKDQDVAQIEEIVRKMTELSRDLGGKDWLGATIFQTLGREINSIVARNIANRTGLLKVMSVVSQLVGAMNAGRIMNVWNIIQNNFSGAIGQGSISLLLANQVGSKHAFKTTKLAAMVLADITKGGVGYGNDIWTFNNRQNLDDEFRVGNIKDNIKDLDLPGLAKSLATYAMRPARALLLGSDGAFKASDHQKGYMYLAHRALVANGMSKEAAIHFMNEMMYGESFEKAQDRAKSLLQKLGMPVTATMIYRVANDLVKGNLNTNGGLSDEVIESAYQSSFDMASVELGQKSQNLNFISRGIEARKREASQWETRLLKEENWGALAIARGVNTLNFGIVAPFIGGISNWVYLSLQSGLGLGIATGRIGSRFKTEVDYTSKSDLREQMFQSASARQDISRGVVGLSYLFLATGLSMAINALRGAAPPDDEDKEGKKDWDRLFDDVKKNYGLKKAFARVAPPVMMMAYLMKTEKNKEVAMAKYAAQYMAMGGDFDVDVQFENMRKNASRGGTEAFYGSLGNLVGSKVEAPLYRSYKNAYYLSKWAVTGNEPPPAYIPSYTMAEGLFGGGLIEDIGLFSRNSPVVSIPGVGPKAAEKMREAGITKVSDLKDHPSWTDYLHNSKQKKQAMDYYKKTYEGIEPSKEELGKSDGSGSGTSW